MNFPRQADDHEFIPRLWATRRVGYLLDEIRLHGENAELRDEVTDLARKYGIVTPYTAYLIVEDEIAPQRAAGDAIVAADSPQIPWPAKTRRRTGILSSWNETVARRSPARVTDMS